MENSRDKQIGEISCIIYAGKTIGTPCVAIANVLYDQGYRKSTDLAEEIFAEIRIMLNRPFTWEEFDEIKKKYTEEGK